MHKSVIWLGIKHSPLLFGKCFCLIHTRKSVSGEKGIFCFIDVDLIENCVCVCVCVCVVEVMSSIRYRFCDTPGEVFRNKP